MLERNEHVVNWEDLVVRTLQNMSMRIREMEMRFNGR